MLKKDLVVGELYAVAPLYAGRGARIQTTSPGKLVEVDAEIPYSRPRHRLIMQDTGRERRVFSKDILCPWEEAREAVEEYKAKKEANAEREVSRINKAYKVVDRLPGSTRASANGEEASDMNPYPITFRLDDVALEALLEALGRVGTIL